MGKMKGFWSSVLQIFIDKPNITIASIVLFCFYSAIITDYSGTLNNYTTQEHFPLNSTKMEKINREFTKRNVTVIPMNFKVPLENLQFSTMFINRPCFRFKRKSLQELQEVFAENLTDFVGNIMSEKESVNEPLTDLQYRKLFIAGFEFATKRMSNLFSNDFIRMCKFTGFGIEESIKLWHLATKQLEMQQICQENKNTIIARNLSDTNFVFDEKNNIAVCSSFGKELNLQWLNVSIFNPVNDSDFSQYSSKPLILTVSEHPFER